MPANMRSGLDPRPDFAAHGPADADRRVQIERAQQERAAERQQQIALQSSPMSTPRERIALWEKLHALDLPRSPSHKLLPIVARQTDLSLEQIHDEQRRRAEGDRADDVQSLDRPYP